ncbi:MAG: hypothetical protein KJ043_07440 [Anaerolineae bacterium]|nr:hypothetical protein [Anaerolineae bacterium]
MRCKNGQIRKNSTDIFIARRGGMIYHAPTPRHILIYLILIFILAACGADGASQQTMVAYNTLASTQRASFYITATVDAERGRITLDAIQDRIDRALDQRQFMLSTLEARGFDVSQLPRPTTPTPAPQSPTPADLPPADVTPLVGDTPLPTAVIITPLAVTPTAFVVQGPAQPTFANNNVPLANSPLRDVVMARDVGNDDCAVGVTNTFSVNSAEIYIVARAVGVQSGTRLSSVWQKSDGTTLVQFDFTPDFDIEDACIWFFAAPEDFPFEAGSYTVTLTVNSQPASNPVPFTIAP